MTEKLFYGDSCLYEFEAVVTSCILKNDRYEVVLNRTAFFPESGGQNADTGTLNGVQVEQVFERDDDIIHVLREELPDSVPVTGKLDWEVRLRKMQNHTGEHMICGAAYRLYGLNNVGFHLGSGPMTCDLDGELSARQIALIEQTVNLWVAENHAVYGRVFENEEAVSFAYRSKNEFKGSVRIVTIEGCDNCACCAPHVKATGQVGIIKIIESIRYKGGMRLTAVCGLDALDDYVSICESNDKISRLLSVKREETSAAVERLLAQRDAQKDELNDWKNRYAAAAVELAIALKRKTVFFDCPADADLMRAAANAFEGGGAALCPDGDGFAFAVCGDAGKLTELICAISALPGGRGGGKGGMIRGHVPGCKDEVSTLFNRFLY